jgi:hypothetical protein
MNKFFIDEEKLLKNFFLTFDSESLKHDSKNDIFLYSNVR